MDENRNDILTYYQKISDGSVTVGRWVRLWYELVLDGISSKTWFYDARKAQNVVNFFHRYVHHNKGPLAPRRIELDLWERAGLSCLMGIVDAQGRRQFNESIWNLGRKQGKTLIAGGVADYFAYVAGEFGSEIYFLAPKLDQADLCYQAFKFSADSEPELAKRTKSTKTGLYIKESNTTVKKLAFSEKKSDGYNPMLFIADEVASWTPPAQGLKQWEVMVSGTGARREPLGLAISSGGYVKDGIYDELVRRGTRVLLGDSREKHLMPLLYRIDDPEKWDDLNELQKSLPGLGSSVSVDFILKEIDIARESFSKQVEFRVKYCGEQMNSSQAWISSATIKKSFNIGHTAEELRQIYSAPEHAFQRRMLEAGKIDEYGNHMELEDFARCYGILGIDLSQTTDLTACTLLIERGGIIYYFVRFFLPESKLEEATARDGIPYEKYVDRGFLQLSGENFVDYSDCVSWIRELYTKHKIYVQMAGLDRYCAQYMQQDIEKLGIKTDTVFQGRNLTGVINMTEGLMKDGRLQSAQDNDLMKLHWMDAALQLESERNLKKLIKLNSRSHVDGVAATLDAMCIRGNIWDKMKNRLINKERE